ncbi:MAG TPA: HAD family hydrolase [Anaerolineales bacterium]|nr:HAD family hydrolase [Anaerolineales bacterium]
MIKALIFDFDGLILDTEVPIFQSWQELYQLYGGELTFENWSTIIGTVSNEHDHFEGLEEQIGHPVDRANLSPKRRQRELELIAQQPIRPGVENLLREARQWGLKIGLASSSPCAWVEGHLRRLGLIDYFDCMRARDDVSQVKPDPELYLSVLEALGLQAEEAIVIEDSPIGITAAKRAGLYCVAVPNELTRQMSIDHADRQLETLAGISLQAVLAQAAQKS